MPAFSLDPAQTAWCAELRALAADRLSPLAEKGDPGHVNRPLVAELGRLGLLDRLFTSGALDLCLMRESLAYACTEAETALALQGLGAHPVHAYGSTAQRERWLPRVIDGSAVAAFALSEPGAGSDAAALALRAEPVAGERAGSDTSTGTEWDDSPRGAVEGPPLTGPGASQRDGADRSPHLGVDGPAGRMPDGAARAGRGGAGTPSDAGRGAGAGAGASPGAGPTGQPGGRPPGQSSAGPSAASVGESGDVHRLSPDSLSPDSAGRWAGEVASAAGGGTSPSPGAGPPAAAAASAGASGRARGLRPGSAGLPPGGSAGAEPSGSGVSPSAGPSAPLGAEPDGVHRWRLLGEKCWISNAPEADFYTVFARTTPDAGARGVTAFLVPADRPGLTGTPIDMLSPHPIGALAFDAVPVTADDVLGEPGRGFRVAMSTLNLFRPSVGAFAVGMARAALDATLVHTDQRQAFGGKLRDLQTVAHQVAEMALRTEAARLMVYAAAAAYDEGDPDVPKRAAMAKLLATETAQYVVDAAVQLHGARALRRGHLLEHLYREVRAPRIYEGASEVQRAVIAKELYATKAEEPR